MKWLVSVCVPQVKEQVAVYLKHIAPVNSSGSKDGSSSDQGWEFSAVW